jgi:hypothetical protein
MRQTIKSFASRETHLTAVATDMVHLSQSNPKSVSNQPSHMVALLFLLGRLKKRKLFPAVSPTH